MAVKPLAALMITSGLLFLLFRLIVTLFPACAARSSARLISARRCLQLIMRADVPVYDPTHGIPESSFPNARSINRRW